MEQDNLWLLGYPEEFYEKAVLEPDFFVDLNMDQIVAQIMAERRDYDLRKYFNRMPEDISATKKRQVVMQAVGDPKLFEGLIRFSEYMQRARGYAADYQTAERQLCRRKLLLDCGMQYALALNVLSEAFLLILPCGKQEFPDGKEGETNNLLGAFAKKFCRYMEGKEFQDFYQDTVSLFDEFGNMRFQVEFVNRRMRVVPAKGEETEDYFDKLSALFPENKEEGRIVRGQLENPFGAGKEVGELEFFVLTACQKKYPESFLKLRKYEQNYSVLKKRELTVQMREKGLSEQVRTPGFFEEWVLVFEQQMQVYLAMELFMRRVRKTGYPLSYALFTKEGDTYGKDSERRDMHSDLEDNLLKLCKAYDLALLLKQKSAEKPVVCNDAYYAGQERFLVVTGPNQGGKTTFARSLGQIVYLAKMGFKAPCAFAYMPYFSGLLTHFSVEESLETGRGKLKEELTRLAPMMCGERGRNFVILNELFTTAATYDAYIMGKRVMAHFIDQDCFGVYVTHIQELADKKEKKTEGGSVQGTQIVSMAACVDEQDSHIRTYRIVRRAPQGVGYAYALVEKYHLTYPELKERLSGILQNQ
ncbi:MAG: hypothetical protein K2N63_02730 [Lachnospiraceae bacterium]|nr:hypothetical protein [Lachnospiraceae bacterium]